jgi:hypothetical protein
MNYECKDKKCFLNLKYLFKKFFCFESEFIDTVFCSVNIT